MRVQGLGFRVQGLGFGVFPRLFRTEALRMLGLRVYDLGLLWLVGLRFGGFLRLGIVFKGVLGIYGGYWGLMGFRVSQIWYLLGGPDVFCGLYWGTTISQFSWVRAIQLRALNFKTEGLHFPKP